MALSDISLVSKTLKNLIENYFKASKEWSPLGKSPIISPQPPDQLTGDAVGMYLYHVSEDAQYKNLPAPGNDMPPVRYVPMGLNLYYQLYACSAAADENATYNEQKMMGFAVKALHDYPVIDDSTEIVDLTGAIVKILHTGLQGADNRLRIVLQPIAHNEAVSYWTAGSSPLRLAAYYQVSVVLLEPEESTSRAGKVLVYDVQTFVGGAPRLDSSQNSLSFTIPGETEPREVELRSAQVPPTHLPPAQVPLDSHVNFRGSGLTGDTTSLFLKNIRWDEPKKADLAWGVGATTNRVSAVVRETIVGETVFPGIYAAIVEVTRQRTLSDGSIRNLKHVSNECPFAITPRIDKITGPANGEWTVKGYIFKDPNPPPIPPPKPPPIPAVKDVQVYIGHAKLKPNKGGALNTGEFKIVNALSLKIKPPLNLSLGDHPLRIFVNGAESPPNWISIT